MLAASELDCSEIDPSILGTLFERGLDPGKRAQLGAHYMDRDKIMLLVEPVVIRPLLVEWEAEKTAITAELERAEAAKSSAARKRRNEAERRLRAFLERMRRFTVLDPACGSGNFLYLALQALRNLEHRVQLDAEALGFQRAFPEVGPANVKGIELNPYAGELARVSVWIGEIHWMRRNGFAEARDPILKPLDTIECRAAILTADNSEPQWPAADVVIGNPPFLGGKLLITHLGEDYRRDTLGLDPVDPCQGLSPGQLPCSLFQDSNGTNAPAALTSRTAKFIPKLLPEGSKQYSLRSAGCSCRPRVKRSRGFLSRTNFSNAPRSWPQFPSSWSQRSSMIRNSSTVSRPIARKEYAGDSAYTGARRSLALPGNASALHPSVTSTGTELSNCTI